jgi:PAS domain S-box-containing protein
MENPGNANNIDLKQMVNALRESEAKLKEAQQLAHIGYWEHDLNSNQITGSEETRRIFGLQSPGGIITQTELLEMIHPDDRQLQQQAISEALRRRGLYDVEYRIVRPDGDVRVVHVRDEIEYDELGRPIRMFGAVQDITDRKQAEEKIQSYATRMEVLAEISRTFAEAGLDYQGVLNTVTKRTAELIGDFCIISLFSEDRQRLFPAAFHYRDPKLRAMELDSLLHMPGGVDSRRYQAVLSGESIYLPVVDSKNFRASLEPEFQPLFDAVGISSFISVPIQVQGQVIGALDILRDGHGVPYTHEDQVLLQDLADRAALTIQNARLFEQVQGAQRRLQILSGQLLFAQEAERRTIARELHDEIGQILSGLMMQLGTAKSLLPRSAKPVENILEQSEELIDQILGRTRAIIAGLRPPVLEDLGLIPALHRLADDFQSNTGMVVKIETDNFPERLPLPLEVALFRIVQEALTNVRKHAQAHQVSIRLSNYDEKLVVSVEDDGLGFEKQPPGPIADGDTVLEGGWRIPADHFGLIGIQERAVQLGGSMKITSSPGQGTNLQVELPFSGTRETTDERL